MPSQDRDELRDEGMQPLGADAVRRFPHLIQRLDDWTLVLAPPATLALGAPTRSLPEGPDQGLSMIARDPDCLIQDLSLLSFPAMPVPLAYCFDVFLNARSCHCCLVG